MPETEGSSAPMMIFPGVPAGTFISFDGSRYRGFWADGNYPTNLHTTTIGEDGVVGNDQVIAVLDGLEALARVMASSSDGAGNVVVSIERIPAIPASCTRSMLLRTRSGPRQLPTDIPPERFRGPFACWAALWVLPSLVTVDLSGGVLGELIDIGMTGPKYLVAGTNELFLQTDSDALRFDSQLQRADATGIPASWAMTTVDDEVLLEDHESSQDLLNALHPDWRHRLDRRLPRCALQGRM